MLSLGNWQPGSEAHGKLARDLNCEETLGCGITLVQQPLVGDGLSAGSDRGVYSLHTTCILKA